MMQNKLKNQLYQMPFLKDFIINQNTKIKLWEVHLGELDYQGLDEHDTDLIKLKKNDLAKEQFWL